MYITDKLIDFLNTSSFLSNSNIILTNLEKVIWASSSCNNDYLNKVLSHDLKRVLNLYIGDISFCDYMNTSMDNIIPIVSDDTCNYISQIILPVIHEHVDGLLIFTANNRKYLPSNLKFAETTRHFTEIFSTRNYLDNIF